MELFNGILRVLQLIFVAIVVGLSASLAKGQLFGPVPALTDFSLFCGIFGFIVASVGIASIFFDKIQGLIMLVLDTLTSLFFVAAGIALAVQFKARSCSGSSNDIYYGKVWFVFNPIINGGTIDGAWDVDVPMTSRCHMAQADTAFIFFAFAAFMGSVILDLMGRRGSGRGLSHV